MSSDYDRLFPRVEKVLLSKAAISMDFWCNGMHVYGGGYYFVWYALTQHWIGLRFAKPGKGAEATRVLAGAEALYSRDERLLWFPSEQYGMHPDERATIAHECTHALRHIMLSGVYAEKGLYGSSIRGQLAADDEAAAYIAGSMFYLYENGVEWPTDTAEETNIFAAANTIAGKLANRRGAPVDAFDLADLRGRISSNPLYLKLWGNNPNMPEDSRGLLGRSS